MTIREQRREELHQLSEQEREFSFIDAVHDWTLNDVTSLSQRELGCAVGLEQIKGKPGYRRHKKGIQRGR